jgi:hypothetical protein
LTLASGHKVEIPLYTQAGNPHAAGIKSLLSILVLHEASTTRPNPRYIAAAHTPVSHLVEQAIAKGGLQAYSTGSKPKKILSEDQFQSLLSDIDNMDFSNPQP